MKSRTENRIYQKERNRERVSNPATLVDSYDSQGSYGEPIIFTTRPTGDIYIYFLNYFFIREREREREIQRERKDRSRERERDIREKEKNI